MADAAEEVPPAWHQGTPAHSTRTALLAARRAALRPDASLDLDGDGVVSERDLFLASRFDRDRDGRLCAKERAAADAALREGFADAYAWQNGAVRRASAEERAVQRQGWFSMEHVYRAAEGRRTRAAVLRDRRAADAGALERASRAYAEAHPRFAGAEGRRRASTAQRREADRRREAASRGAREAEARARAGLAPRPQDVNPGRAPPPGLGRRERPPYRTAAELREAQRREAAGDARRAAERAERDGFVPAAERKRRRAEEAAARAEAAAKSGAPRPSASALRERRRDELRKAGRRLGDTAAEAARPHAVHAGSDKPFYQTRGEGESGAAAEAAAADPRGESPYPRGERTLVATRRAHSRLAGSISRGPAPDASKDSLRAQGVWRPKLTEHANRMFAFQNDIEAAARRNSRDRAPSRLEVIECTQPLYSSFARDNVFREPVYVTRHRPRSRVCSGDLAEAQREAAAADRGGVEGSPYAVNDGLSAAFSDRRAASF